jgi:hypothetical protein
MNKAVENPQNILTWIEVKDIQSVFFRVLQDWDSEEYLASQQGKEDFLLLKKIWKNILIEVWSEDSKYGKYFEHDLKNDINKIGFFGFADTPKELNPMLKYKKFATRLLWVAIFVESMESHEIMEDFTDITLVELTEVFIACDVVWVDINISWGENIVFSMPMMHVTRCLLNIVSNAKKHGQATQVNVELKMEWSRGVMEIKNNGSPIPRRMLEIRKWGSQKIFTSGESSNSTGIWLDGWDMLKKQGISIKAESDGFLIYFWEQQDLNLAASKIWEKVVKTLW